MDPHDLEPSVPWPPESSFARRLNEEKNAKRHVAVAVVQRFLPPGVAAFIGDGSSTFWVGLAVFRRALEEKKGHTRLFTVNLAIQDEFAFGLDPSGLVRLFGGEGETHRELFTVWGDDTNAFVAKAVEKSRCAILAVNALTAHLGPFGVDDETSPIKCAAIRAIGPERELVVVADHKKLALLPVPPSEPKLPRRVLGDRAEWTRLIDNPNFYVVTTRYPGAPLMPKGRLPQNAPKSELAKLNPADRYAFQAHYLKQNMGDRFIECPACQCLAA